MSDEQDIPYHMQDDSDEEALTDTDGESNAEHASLRDSDKVKETQESLTRRRARVGKVELDPKIRLRKSKLLILATTHSDFQIMLASERMVLDWSLELPWTMMEWSTSG